MTNGDFYTIIPRADSVRHTLTSRESIDHELVQWLDTEPCSEGKNLPVPVFSRDFDTFNT